jgi:transposase
MMEFQTDSQGRLFCSSNVEDHVPKNRLLRGINQYLNPGNLRQHLSAFCSHTGRPSIDPELLVIG